MSSARTSGPGRVSRLQAWMRHHRQVARDSLARIRSTPVQSGLMIAVIAIAGSLPASIYQLGDSIKGISGDISRTSDIQVFFQQDAPAQTITELTASWRQMAGIAAVEVIDPDTGRQLFEQYSGLGSVLDLLEQNPLPSVARLTPDADIARDPAALDSLMDQLGSSPEVEQVQFDFAWLERLDALLTLVDRVNLVMGLLLGTGIVLVLINSVRLMIDNRKDEIIIVKLVGGTNEFVRRPLLYTGFWLGLFGGIAAVLVADLASLALAAPMQFLLGSYALDGTRIGLLDGAETLGLIALCAGLGLIGAWLAVAQHLDAIEPR